jgi:transposase
MDNSTAPATKGDLQGAVEQLRTEMNHQYNDLVERIADSETKLLQAFYSFAQSNQQRFTQVESNTNAVTARLAILETRLLDVEQRLNMPPAA